MEVGRTSRRGPCGASLPPHQPVPARAQAEIRNVSSPTLSRIRRRGSHASLVGKPGRLNGRRLGSHCAAYSPATDWETFPVWSPRRLAHRRRRRGLPLWRPCYLVPDCLRSALKGSYMLAICAGTAEEVAGAHTAIGSSEAVRSLHYAYIRNSCILLSRGTVGRMRGARREFVIYTIRART